MGLSHAFSVRLADSSIDRKLGERGLKSDCRQTTDYNARATACDRLSAGISQHVRLVCQSLQQQVQWQPNREEASL